MAGCLFGPRLWWLAVWGGGGLERRGCFGASWAGWRWRLGGGALEGWGLWTVVSRRVICRRIGGPNPFSALGEGLADHSAQSSCSRRQAGGAGWGAGGRATEGVRLVACARSRDGPLQRSGWRSMKAVVLLEVERTSAVEMVSQLLKFRVNSYDPTHSTEFASCS